MSRATRVVLAALLALLFAGMARADGKPASDPGVVNLNVASPDELERLPGIGPAKAKAIVEHRRAHPFHKVDELTKVKGIGRKTFGKLRPYITVSGATTLKSEPRSGLVLEPRK